MRQPSEYASQVHYEQTRQGAALLRTIRAPVVHLGLWSSAALIVMVDFLGSAGRPCAWREPPGTNGWWSGLKIGGHSPLCCYAGFELPCMPPHLISKPASRHRSCPLCRALRTLALHPALFNRVTIRSGARRLWVSSKRCRNVPSTSSSTNPSRASPHRVLCRAANLQRRRTRKFRP